MTMQAMPETSTTRALRAHAGPQPYAYPPSIEYVEPDWTRLPGYRDVTEAEWYSAKWQRQNTVKNLDQLSKTLGDLLPARPLCQRHAKLLQAFGPLMKENRHAR